MAERVYVETTVVSYLTAWPSRDVVLAGHQAVTHDWWNARRTAYELCISQLVRTEAAAGDSQAAQDRLAALQTMTVLETTEAAWNWPGNWCRRAGQGGQPTPWHSRWRPFTPSPTC